MEKFHLLLLKQQMWEKSVSKWNNTLNQTSHMNKKHLKKVSFKEGLLNRMDFQKIDELISFMKDSLHYAIRLEVRLDWMKIQMIKFHLIE